MKSLAGTVFKRAMTLKAAKKSGNIQNALQKNADSQEHIQNLPLLNDQQQLEKVGKYTNIGFITKSKRIIISISSVFPFELFPSTIEVEDNKVTVIYRQFFWCSQTQSMDMQDISNTFIETAPFFATLKIITRSFVENTIKIPWLKRGEAVHARNIIEGLRVFSQERIDTSKYELRDLIARLEALSSINITMHRA